MQIPRMRWGIPCRCKGTGVETEREREGIWRREVGEEGERRRKRVER